MPLQTFNLGGIRSKNDYSGIANAPQAYLNARKSAIQNKRLEQQLQNAPEDRALAQAFKNAQIGNLNESSASSLQKREYEKKVQDHDTWLLEQVYPSSNKTPTEQDSISEILSKDSAPFTNTSETAENKLSRLHDGKDKRKDNSDKKPLSEKQLRENVVKELSKDSRNKKSLVRLGVIPEDPKERSVHGLPNLILQTERIKQKIDNGSATDAEVAAYPSMKEAVETQQKNEKSQLDKRQLSIKRHRYDNAPKYEKLLMLHKDALDGKAWTSEGEEYKLTKEEQNRKINHLNKQMSDLIVDPATRQKIETMNRFDAVARDIDVDKLYSGSGIGRKTLAKIQKGLSLTGFEMEALNDRKGEVTKLQLMMDQVGSFLDIKAAERIQEEYKDLTSPEYWLRSPAEAKARYKAFVRVMNIESEALRRSSITPIAGASMAGTKDKRETLVNAVKGNVEFTQDQKSQEQVLNRQPVDQIKIKLGVGELNQNRTTENQISEADITATTNSMNSKRADGEKLTESQVLEMMLKKTRGK